MFTRSQAAVQRGNPVECIGCQHPCQQELPVFGTLLLIPDARVCHLHFATPASAFFFFHSPHRRAPLRAVLGNMTIVQSTSVNHHWTRYHQGRHYLANRAITTTTSPFRPHQSLTTTATTATPSSWWTLE
ncbi:hypothetical protein DM01DRAFT_1378314 [Hesseltinella vesiculosa]|uniref:Uncharacterized protein n=1 Tax=Hesseltinella vesiculosa TaxID=101127 RepID=A0A1X2G4S2_9FUNG|nr:hypothetical protein DM01DRAFT_1378314 [Hesseltinella vesiculosa]